MLIIKNENNLGYQLQYTLSGSVPQLSGAGLPSGILVPGSGTAVLGAGPGPVTAGLTLIPPFPLTSFQVTSGTTLTVSITVSD